MSVERVEKKRQSEKKSQSYKTEYFSVVYYLVFETE
jgi:hypothetical protein